MMLVCTVAGFVVASSMMSPKAHYYNASIFYFTNNGQLVSVLPFVGKGPYNFCPVFLKANPEMVKKQACFADSGWYLVLKDGHGGICCLDLEGTDI